MADTLLQQQLILKIRVGKGNQAPPSQKIISDIKRQTQSFLMFTRKSGWQTLSSQSFPQNIKPACSLLQFALCLLLKIVKQLPLSLSFPHLLTCRLFLSSPLLHRGHMLLSAEIPTPLSPRRRLLPTSFLKYFFPPVCLSNTPITVPMRGKVVDGKAHPKLAVGLMIFGSAVMEGFSHSQIIASALAICEEEKNILLNEPNAIRNCVC